MTHTPGPWTAKQEAITWWEIHADSSRHPVCHVTKRVDHLSAPLAADARLIAAAPAMLERLKAMVSGMECECDTADPEHPLCDICWSRQVIASAEGRTE